MKKLFLAVLIVICFCSFSVSFAQGTKDQLMKGRFSIDFKIDNRWSQSGILFGNADEEYVVPKRKTELGEHIGYEAGFGYHLTNHIYLRLSAGYYNNNIQNFAALVDPDRSLWVFDSPTEDEFYVGLGIGEFTEIPVSMTANWVFRPNQRFRMLAGVGLGYSFCDLKEEDLNAQIARYNFNNIGDETVGANINPPTYTVIVDNSVIYHADFGVDVDLSKHWSACVSTRFLYGKKDIEVNLFQDGKEYEMLWMNGDQNFTTSPEYWQFKGGDIPLERWEIAIGAKYTFGGGSKAPEIEKEVTPIEEPEEVEEAEEAEEAGEPQE